MDIKRNVKAAQNQLGIDNLRKHQVKPINNLLDGNDTMVIAPTSAGKSAIYQVPGLILPELTVVIEPTLSLIYDQVNKMQSLGIRAEYVDSSQNQFDRMSLQKLLEKQKIEFLFITPEQLQNQFLTDILHHVSISLVVVDECHCVTEWGYSFRSAYLSIGKWIQSLCCRPVIAALTATATPAMRPEICSLLSLDSPDIFVNSLLRPNLHFITRSFVSDEAKLKELKRLLRKHTDGSCIVYCNTKKMTKAVYDEVKKWYPDDAAICHSNLGKHERKNSEQQFLNGERRIMVATSAFGLGVDQSSVNLVIHFNLPLSLIDYYQQAGRAGRAGQKSKCVLLYCENDYHVNRMIIKENCGKPVRKESTNALDRMKEYAESSECLTQQLLSALGETTDRPCGSCTNCQKARKKK